MTTIETADQAIMRAARVAMDAIRCEVSDLKTADELPDECAVRVCHDWYGFGGLDSQGRMVLWRAGLDDPFFYGPTTGDTFAWRPLIGDK